jgi:hypothetical protein
VLAGRRGSPSAGQVPGALRRVPRLYGLLPTPLIAARSARKHVTDLCREGEDHYGTQTVVILHVPGSDQPC